MYQHIIREAQRCSTASATLAAPHSSATLTATAAACAAPGCLTQLPQCKRSKIPVAKCTFKPMQHMNLITTTSTCITTTSLQAPHVPLGAINQNQVSMALSPLQLKRAPTHSAHQRPHCASAQLHTRVQHSVSAACGKCKSVKVTSMCRTCRQTTHASCSANRQGRTGTAAARA